MDPGIEESGGEPVGVDVVNRETGKRRKGERARIRKLYLFM